MASSRKNKPFLLGLVLVTLAGCSAEYKNNWDRVSTRSGNAMEANTAIMEVEPSNENNTSTNIGQ